MSIIGPAEARRLAKKSQVRRMKAEHWKRLIVKGIKPFTIDRVEGTIVGRGNVFTAPLVWVTGYDLLHPDGTNERFAFLDEAKAKARELLEARKQ